jgi:predicted secreted protein
MAMSISFRTTAGCALLALCAATPVRAETPAPQGVLSLTASASVEVPRDLLSVTFSTTKEGADANAVQAQLKQALDAALGEAKKAARPGQLDVQTGSFSLYPRYASKGGINGWQGTAQVIVEGRDMAAIGALTGRIASMTIAGVDFRLSREASQKVEGEVTAEAIARYRGKANEYAKQFGYAGYTIREVNVSTGDAQPIMVPRARMTAMSSAPSADPLSVEPGKAVVTATVSGSVQMK